LNINKPLIIHPFLFAAFPVLFLFAHNIKELEFSVIIIPITFVLFFTLLLLFLFRLILRDDQKAAVLLSFALILFFSYGSFSQLTENFRLFIGKFIIGPKKLFFIAWSILFYFGTYFIVGDRADGRFSSPFYHVPHLQDGTPGQRPAFNPRSRQ